MRLLLIAGILAATVGPAAAETVDKATLDKVFAVATRGYQNPAAATMRSVHKSAARNGLGYCGEVTVESDGGFTIFHVLLPGPDGKGASVLRLVDYPESDTSRNAIAVRQMIVNFGCTR